MSRFSSICGLYHLRVVHIKMVSEPWKPKYHGNTLSRNLSFQWAVEKSRQLYVFMSLTFQSLLSYLKNIFKNAVVHFWAYLDIQTLLSEPCHYEKNTAGRSARIYKKQDRTEKNIEAKRIMIAAFQELFNEKKYTSKTCLIFFSSWFPMMFFLQMV